MSLQSLAYPRADLHAAVRAFAPRRTFGPPEVTLCIWPTVRTWPGAMPWEQLARAIPSLPRGVRIEIRDDDSDIWKGEKSLREVTREEAELYCWLQHWATK